MLVSRIFGIGLGRTGTKSLAQAMGILGYSSKHGGNVYDIEKYEFMNDIVIAARYKLLDYYYGPIAKFILTVRDVESWIRSSIVLAGRRGGRRGKDGVIRGTKLRRAEHRFMIYGITHFDETIFREVHAQFDKEAIAHFKDQPKRLLVMNICKGDGWEQLCPFLEKPIPDMPFPRLNAAQKEDIEKIDKLYG